jgi:hypothetical protein
MDIMGGLSDAWNWTGHALGLGSSDAQKGQVEAYHKAAARTQAAMQPTMQSYQNLLANVQAAYRPSQGMLNAMYGGQRMYGPGPQAPAPQPMPMQGHGGGLYDTMMNAARDAQANKASFQQHADLYYNPSLSNPPPGLTAPPQPNAPNMNGGYSTIPRK